MTLVDRLKTALADRYLLERELGEGGMATVYLAQDLKHRRKVALKVLRPELAAIIGAERFLKEIEVTANLQHPNILPLYDSGEANTYLYYVMPYVEGESLRDKLTREKQLAVEETVEIAKGVAAALQFAHEHGVIHRDIKPENVLLQSGQPVVADFGIALAISHAGGTRLTETGLSLGTPHYMSPEQAGGDRQLDARTDIYSLGAMVYEMLTGDPPHSGNTVQAVVAKILTESPSPISRTRSLVPHNVEAAVEKALAKAPADRFASAAKFAEALLNPAFTLTRAAGSGDPGTGWVTRWGRLNLGVGLLGAALAVTALWGWVRPTPPKLVSRYSMRLPDEERLASGSPGRVALAPDGRSLVYVGPGGEGTRLWVRARDQLRASPLPGTERAGNPFFSPDGSRVGFVTTDNPAALKTVPLNGGPATTVTDSVALWGGSWGGDGYIYFVSRLGRQRPGMGIAFGIARVPETGGAPERLTTPDTSKGEAWHFQPDPLPNGKGVLFTIARGRQMSRGIGFQGFDVAMMDVSTGAHRVLASGFSPHYAASGHLLWVTADGALKAAPFDQDRLTLTGDAVVVAEGLALSGVTADIASSATGSLVYVARGGASVSTELVWVTRDGTVTAVDPAWAGEFHSIALSPDGTQLAVSVRRDPGVQVWVKRLDRGPAWKLTLEGTNIRPTWTADGRRVAFFSLRGQVFDMLMAPADGSSPAQRRGEVDLATEAKFSRDGEWLVYRDGDVHALRTRGDSTRLDLVGLVGTPFDETTPAISPDGRWLAYVSEESGRHEVYVRPFPNTGTAKWQVSPNGGTEPVWARSGRELFFRSGRNELVSVPIPRGETFEMGEQRVLFSTAPFLADPFSQVYDVSPDGQRFVMIRQVLAGGVLEELIVVENFFEELKAKVKRSRVR